jgi:hypothetical protein
VKLTTQLHLGARLIMRGAEPPLPIRFYGVVLNQAHGQMYLYFIFTFQKIKNMNARYVSSPILLSASESLCSNGNEVNIGGTAAGIIFVRMAANYSRRPINRGGLFWGFV